MKTQAHRTVDAGHIRLAANLETGMQALFHRCPTLCGFSVRSAASLLNEGLDLRHVGDLFVTDVSVYPQRDLEAPGEVCREIMAAIVALVDASPAAGELLRERAFARVFH